MFFKRNKFNKLKREEVINAICELEQEEQNLESQTLEFTKQIEDLLGKGRTEKNHDLKLLYAKKITYMRNMKGESLNRCMYLLYNINLLNRLKTAIDDNNFYIKTGKISLSNLLSNQKDLAVFLNKALNRKISAEDVLTNADNLFNEVQAACPVNDTIYGVNENEDDLLAVFEENADEVLANASEENRLKEKNGAYNGNI